MGFSGEREPSPPAPGSAAGDGVAASEPALDAAALDRLRDLDPGGQQGVLPRVLQTYERSLAKHLVDISAGARSGSLDALARAVHTLKSSSAAVGALRLSQQCAQVEQKARIDRQLPSERELDALLAEGRRVRQAVEAMLTS